MLLAAAIILAASVMLFNVIDAREQAEAPAARTQSAAAEAPIGDGNAFALVLRNRYLLLIGVIVLLLNWVNATGEYVLSSIVQRAAEDRVAAGSLSREQEGAFIGAFYADYFQVVNIVGMLLQLFLVSRIVKYLGVHVAVCVLPVVALGSYAVAALLPSLAVVRWVKTAENSVDYSLQNTVKQMLFLPTSREEKYKAKQVTDSLIVRAGDVLSSATVFVGTTALALGTSQFAWINVVLVSCWLMVAVMVGREFRRARTDASAEARRRCEGDPRSERWLSRWSRWSLSTRIVFALVLGVLVGLFFGETAAVLQPLADVYIRLMQMTVLPYLVLTLIIGLGRMEADEARRLALRGCVLLVVFWALTLAVIGLMPLAFPSQESASFFSTSLLQQREPLALHEIYVPSNPFHALANAVIPGVVLFSSALGVALIGVKNKGTLMLNLQIVEQAVVRVTRFVISLTPFGVLAIVAVAAGTLDLETIERLEVYLVCFRSLRPCCLRS